MGLIYYLEYLKRWYIVYIIFFSWLLFTLQVDLYLLPQAAFPTGGLYFKNKTWVKETKGKHVIIHNNYIVGFEKKIKRFRDYGLWLVDDHAQESPLGGLWSLTDDTSLSLALVQAFRFRTSFLPIFSFCLLGGCFLKDITTVAVNTPHWLNDGLERKWSFAFNVVKKKSAYKM